MVTQGPSYPVSPIKEEKSQRSKIREQKGLMGAQFFHRLQGVQGGEGKAGLEVDVSPTDVISDLALR